MPISSGRQSGLDAPKTNATPTPTPAVAGAGTAIDPVCGMTVTLKADTRTETFDGKPFHFRSEKCQTKCKGDPLCCASGNARQCARLLSDLRHGAGACGAI